MQTCKYITKRKEALMFTYARAFPIADASLGRLLVTLRAGVAVARERRALARLDARELDDIGIDPAAAAAEVARPFWDIPAERR